MKLTNERIKCWIIGAKADSTQDNTDTISVLEELLRLRELLDPFIKATDMNYPSDAVSIRDWQALQQYKIEQLKERR